MARCPPPRFPIIRRRIPSIVRLIPGYSPSSMRPMDADGDNSVSRTHNVSEVTWLFRTLYRPLGDVSETNTALKTRRFCCVPRQTVGFLGLGCLETFCQRTLFCKHAKLLPNEQTRAEGEHQRTKFTSHQIEVNQQQHLSSEKRVWSYLTTESSHTLLV